MFHAILLRTFAFIESLENKSNEAEAMLERMQLTQLTDDHSFRDVW